VTALPPERKRIRLPSGAYLIPGSAWLVTIDTADRAAHFADADLAHQVADLLCNRCLALGATLDAYCLMPDHAHVLVQIGRTGLVDLVRDVKSRSTRIWWRHGGAGPLWQRSFHDRSIRSPADHDRAVAYVLHNPVRAGLVADWRDYPLLGGALIDEPS